jgi:hypothetical protein
MDKTISKNKLYLPKYWRDSSLIENFPSIGFLLSDRKFSVRIPNVEDIGSWRGPIYIYISNDNSRIF